MIGDAGAPLSDRPVTLCTRNTEKTGLAAAESMRAGRVWAIVALAGACAPAYAGPPLITDDPEPVEKGHWEINIPYTLDLSARDENGKRTWTHETPLLDITYGVIEGVHAKI